MPHEPSNDPQVGGWSHVGASGCIVLIPPFRTAPCAQELGTQMEAEGLIVHQTVQGGMRSWMAAKITDQVRHVDAAQLHIATYFQFHLFTFTSLILNHLHCLSI